MRTITVISSVTLDGIIQGMGAPQEDHSGGFRFGGWTRPYGDAVSAALVREKLDQSSDYLLGRHTFEIWEPYWPHHADYWPNINTGQKYVLSNTRRQSDWANTTFIRTVDDIRSLKASDGPTLQVWGSGKLVQLLLRHDLVDELHLQVFPLLLGQGKKLFDDQSSPTAFELIDSQVTTTGVIASHYRRI